MWRWRRGLHRIGRLFHEVADNEKCHAMAEFKAYNRLLHDIELDTTAKNLQYAADGERYEHEEMYPGFAAVVQLFRTIGKVEVEHEKE